jgi:hypothetical protein
VSNNGEGEDARISFGRLSSPSSSNTMSASGRFMLVEMMTDSNDSKRPFTNPHTLFDQEIHNIPENMRRFLVRDGAHSTYAKTWEYFANAYGRAFDELAELILRDWPNRNHMDEAVFFLCRHSIELSIKNSILGCSEPDVPEIAGHNLLNLWNQLQAIMAKHGFEEPDEWTAHCTKLIEHINEFDPDGEHFRYPTDRKHNPFEFTRVELEGLAVAHWHIGMLCEANVEMLDAQKAGKL